MTYANPFAPSAAVEANCASPFHLVKCFLKQVVLAGVAIIIFDSPSYAETISPRRLVEVADLSGPVVSPDGRSVAFRLEQASIERNTYDSVWYVQGLDGNSPPRRVADGGTPLRDTAGSSVPGFAVWSPDGRWIYYRALVDGKIDVWRAAMDGSGSEPLTLDPADVRDFALSADGRTLNYSVGATREEVISAEQAEYDRGIRIDETVPIGQSLFRSGAIEGRLATQRYSGEWMARAPLLAEVPDHWKAVDLTTLATLGIPPSDVPSFPPKASDLSGELPTPSTIALNKEDSRVAILTRVGQEEGRLAKPYVELAVLPSKNSTRPIRCRDELCTNKNITDIQWRLNSGEVLFTVTDRHEGRAQSIFAWNISTGLVRRIVQARGTLGGSRMYWDSSCGLSSDLLVCVAAEADRPPRLEAIDLTTGRRQVLFEPNSALDSDIAATMPARLIQWIDVRGREYTGQLFEARRMGAASLPPLFVTFYTCDGFLRGGLGDEWPLASLERVMNFDATRLWYADDIPQAVSDQRFR